MKKLRTLFAAAAIAWVSAAYPINIRVTLNANPDGVRSTTYPCTAADRSNCAPPVVATLACSDGSAPSLSGQTTGTVYSENARAYFTGTAAATATLNVATVSGSDAATTGWQIIGGDNLYISSGTAGVGSLRVTGTTGGASPVNCSARNWSRVSPGADSTAPTVPTGLSVALNGSNKPVLTFDAPCDPNVSGSASGLASYTVTRNGSTLATVAISGGGTTFTSSDVGAVSPAGTTSNTNGGDFLEVSEGAIGGVADRHHFTSTSVTGDFVATAYVESFANVTFTYAKTGIMARDTTSTSARFVQAQMRPGALTALQYRAADGGAIAQASSTGAQSAPGYIQLIRSGDTWTMKQSADGANWITTVPATTVLLPSTVLVGLATSSESSGNPITVQYRKLCIRSAASITYTDSTAAAGTTYTYTVHATDVAGNSSAETASVSITPTPTAAADYTVKSSGGSFTNTTAGITAAIAAANAAYSGTDKIIEFQDATPGVAETWNAMISCTSKDHWRIRVRDGDTVKLSGATNGLLVSGCNYWIVQGNSTGRTGLEFGNTAQWTEAQPSLSGYTATRQIDVSTSSHGIIRNLTTHGSKSFVANLLWRTDTMMLIDNISANLHGTNCPPAGTGACTSDAAGELFELGASYSIVQNSSFNMGGHELLNLYCHHCIARDNDFNGDWSSKNTGAPGYRAVDMSTQDVSNWHSTSDDPTTFGPVLFERNFTHTINAVNTTKPHTQSMTVRGFDSIVRGNYDYDNATGQTYNTNSFLSTNVGEAMSRIHIYNNTTYNSQGLLYSDDSQFSAQGTTNCREFKLYNNIAALTGSNGNGTATGLWTTSKCAAGANSGGYPNGLKGSEFDSNLISGTSTDKRWFLIMPGVNTHLSWGDSTTYPDSTNGYIARNVDTPITFVNPTAHTAAGFALASTSPGVGTARWVTTTTNAGTNTTLTLADPYYFSDGWGIDNSAMGEAVEKGDWIAVTPTSGGTIDDVVCTRITSITYSTGAIVVTPAVTHANGSKVWPAGDGTTCQPWRNQGASQ